MPQAKSDCHFPGSYLLNGARSGILDVGACIFINIRQDILCLFLPIFANQRLDQKPCGRGTLDVRHRYHVLVDGICQVLDGCRHWKAILLHHLRVIDNRPFLGSDWRIIRRIFIQRACLKF